LRPLVFQCAGVVELEYTPVLKTGALREISDLNGHY
jgi:hypothetical protein